LSSAVMRSSRLPATGVLALLGCLALAAAACGSPPARDGADQPSLPPEFTTPVAAAQQAGLPVYWLGPQFDVEGLTSRVIGAESKVADQGPSMRVEYEANSQDRGALDLTLTTYGVDAWQQAKTRVTPRTEGVIRQSVTVAGWPAELFSIPVGQWTNRVVIVDASEAVIVASANTTIARGQRQVNLLVDPSSLLSVLQNLRPYPE
jgi:hypothetical protein